MTMISNKNQLELSQKEPREKSRGLLFILELIAILPD